MALCSAPTWISAWPNWLARSRPSGFGELGPDAGGPGLGVDLGPDPGHPARSKASSLVPRDGEVTGWPGLTWRDVALVDVDPEPHPRRVGDGEELRCRLDGLALDRMPHDHRPVDRGDDVRRAPRVLGLRGSEPARRRRSPKFLSFCSASDGWPSAWFRAVSASSSSLAGDVRSSASVFVRSVGRLGELHGGRGERYWAFAVLTSAESTTASTSPAGRPAPGRPAPRGGSPRPAG